MEEIAHAQGRDYERGGSRWVYAPRPAEVVVVLVSVSVRGV